VISNDESPLPDTEVHYVRSEHVGDEFKVLVGHCESPAPAPEAVLFMGDTWANFGTAVEIVRLMRFTEVVPPMLVVGTGYRTTDIGEIEDLRCRDFTPTADPAGGYTDPAKVGAARFLSFLRDEAQALGAGAIRRRSGRLDVLRGLARWALRNIRAPH
jgi:hypothetical protein